MVEVVMYSTLTALVLTILAGLLSATFQAHAVAGQRDAATGRAQVASGFLQTTIRNASTLLVSGTVVQARVATGANGWQCTTWALTTDGNLVYKSASTAITSTDYTTWTVLASGVTGRLAGGAAFTGSSTQASYALGFTSGDVTVPLAGEASANAFGPGSPESCW